MKVKLNSNGYTKSYESGKRTSIVGGYENDEEVSEFIANGGTVEDEFTQAEIDAKELAETEAQEWADYEVAEKADKKAKWKQKGKPSFVGN